MYRHVEYYPGDPILSLVETFKRDERPEKVNLSIGIYFDDEGKMPVLESVRRAEAERAAVSRPSPYLPMEGLDTYRSAVQHLLFGKDNPALAEGRVATVQTLGGSGALKVGADFLRRWFPMQKPMSAIRLGTTIKAFLKAQVLKWGRILITTLKPSA